VSQLVKTVATALFFVLVQIPTFTFPPFRTVGAGHDAKAQFLLRWEYIYTGVSLDPSPPPPFASNISGCLIFYGYPASLYGDIDVIKNPNFASSSSFLGVGSVTIPANSSTMNYFHVTFIEGKIVGWDINLWKGQSLQIITQAAIVTPPPPSEALILWASSSHQDFTAHGVATWSGPGLVLPFPRNICSYL
jgi:hypothetical protein